MYASIVLMVRVYSYYLLCYSKKIKKIVPPFRSEELFRVLPGLLSTKIKAVSLKEKN